MKNKMKMKKDFVSIYVNISVGAGARACKGLRRGRKEQC